ncbi:hypothetical protein [Streptomyces yaizuensis]|uniref:PT domain-containing protein n=1 Tax=Streptomyces yaizuensis TaxID=2989713 RepID=A0ABQ5P6A5_9ACTN|nr:hypothetical protein [Streptomyces sp. YSPA8]GLF98131.1 PT domain-containing protein [Streptomyces sp. YSPA8]
MHPPDTTRPPTLLDALLDKYQWTPYRVFRARFKEAGQNAARKLRNSRLRGLDLTETTYRRWRQGTQEPTGDFATVLEFLFGIEVKKLLQPAPVNWEYTAVRDLDPQTLSAAYQVDRRMPTSSLFLTAPPGGGGLWHLHGGDAGVFDGTQVAVAAYEARPGAGGAVIGDEDLDHVRMFTRPARRGLVLGSLSGRGRDVFHLMDGTAAREATALPFVRDLTVPDAYRLDDLTYALVWAALCFDDWLQADDVLLTAERERLEHGAVGRTGFARSALPGLSSAGAVWLGSHVCAVHAERHLADSGGGVPVLWSQVRSGPEAAAWLLLRDRLRVLELLRPPGGTGQGQMAVCLPEKAVGGSEPYERMLLLLFAALLESRGIVISVSDDPAYEVMEEVLVAERMAVVGNWVPRGDGICAAATAEDPARVALYAGAVAHARAHSVIAAGDSTGRLLRLAAYLDLDAGGLAGRCRELTASGIGGLVRTRSHLLHMGGLEASLSRLADLSR